MDAITGKEHWKFTAYNVITSSPTIVGNTLVIGSRDTYLYGFDALSGQEKWAYRFVDRSWVESTATKGNEDNVFFIGSSDSKKLLKFDANSGKEIWSASTPGWTWARPFVANDQVFIGTIGARGYWNKVEPGFISVSAKTGKRMAQYQPKEIEGYVSGGVFGSPAVLDQKIYVPDLDGNLYEFLF